MKLVVLGATGGTGREVIRQAVNRAHLVTAFVRNAGPLQLLERRISIVKGNLLNQSELEKVIRGQDAVVSAFGAHAGGSGTWRQFAMALTQAMAHSGVRRLVAVSVAFLFKDSIIPPAFLLGRLFFPNTVVGASQMEEVVAQGGLDWTIVRPPRLTDGPYTGKYRTREGHLPRFGFKVARADVADFILNAVGDHTLFRKIVGVCY